MNACDMKHEPSFPSTGPGSPSEAACDNRMHFKHSMLEKKGTTIVLCHICGIGMVLSLIKTEALVKHPRAALRRHFSCLQLRGSLICWHSCVRYLGLTIDNWVWCVPPVKGIRQATHRVGTCVP
ncbi:hypothetical protein HPB51_018176 [Rhipicephalus microplus]|uniref:Uncharacterized protein n=1 Tax=Rhipicephalus microplus TaxID=6941 RepID=A0A9J6D659_RHIMP|nr:hypothetical protein HPB51_018176 [Rhipicephalus microplus]